MKEFSGPVLFLDRSDINTDEIIPAKYLTEITKEALKPYLLEDLTLPEFDPSRDIPGKRAVVTRDNFGCGSSREHAPWALEVNGINLVIAVSFARIFRQNMYNCGMLAVELSAETIDRLFADFAGLETTVEVDFSRRNFRFSAASPKDAAGSGPGEIEIPFTVSEFDSALVEAGGWVEYADAKY
jgi:3-isopropylmalate/(R)-2-methylmalate dehydratase small subunit